MKIISPLITVSCTAYFFIIAIASADERSSVYQPTSELRTLNPIVLSRQRADELIERPDHRCGPSIGGCREGRCCSGHGWCGDTPEYCRDQRVPRADQTLLRRTSSDYDHGVSEIVSRALFDSMLNSKDCPGRGFYSYGAFLTAAASFPGFGTTGDVVTRKRELAAFFGQTSQAISGKGLYYYSDHSWGYCRLVKRRSSRSRSRSSEYCTSHYWPCAYAQSYHARGPIQLTHNYNYGLAGKALGLDLINNPDLVATDPIVAFKTALWFWMTHHDDKPSCHDIVIQASSKSSRYRYGDIGSIIRGESPGLVSNGVTTSTGFYKRYCDMLGVSYGENFKDWYDSNHRDYYQRSYFYDDETKPSSVDETQDQMKAQVVEEIYL